MKLIQNIDLVSDEKTMNSNGNNEANTSPMMKRWSRDREDVIKMVVIEDDHEIASLIRMVVRAWQLPIDVEFRIDGYSGASYILRTQPDIIILDMKLPVLDGFSVLDATKPDTWGASVILATGMSRDELVSLGCLAESYYYLQKPIDLSRLEKMLVHLIGTIRLKRNSG
ncbi:Response regulator receiver domain-containing protein [Mariprofundus ferrinatatus]|uniref:Response regulator receiver domain-containing protein n=1 Tax=Mariprofundus ferrinatatus TaxID=1921087 RepID=A0A2K8LEL7_9PROT|nr:response regulator [Mariprofundus ferrinatatus]ATX82716.1 Response regulator receiver domain-containing protein [Mariprofundus ferrinatatus]